jgi:four helix bundle protein
MNAEEMRGRTKEMALRVVRLAEALPKRPGALAIRGQIIRSSMSVAANYRAAQRGRTRREFLAKLGVALEECDETVFWLEMIQDAGLFSPHRVQPLIEEATQIVKILSAAKSTMKTGAGHC